MRSFIYNGLPARVVFGAGALARLPEELDRLGARRALVLSTPEQAESARQVAKALGARCAGTYDKAAMHVPVEIAEDARRAARASSARTAASPSAAAPPRGSARRSRSPRPFRSSPCPTTYAGSEMTPIYGITEGGAKKTGRDVRVLPKAVIYDPTLTLSLPPALSAASGMNAIAHAVGGALFARGQSHHLAHGGGGHPRSGECFAGNHANPEHFEARSEAFTARGSAAWCSARPAWRCTTSSATCSAAASTCRTPRRTRSFCRTRCATTTTPRPKPWLASRGPFRLKDAAAGIYDLEKSLGLPMRLADIGMKEADLERAARIATEAPYPNPRKVDYAAVLELLRSAYLGHRP